MGAISVSCRYFYRNGSCAHSSVSGDRCVGASTCGTYTTVDKPGAEGDSAGKYNYTAGVQCECNLGFGLYCTKYNRFYCAGKEKCGSADEYMRSFDAHRKTRRGV